MWEPEPETADSMDWLTSLSEASSHNCVVIAVRGHPHPQHTYPTLLDYVQENQKCANPPTPSLYQNTAFVEMQTLFCGAGISGAENS